MKQIILDTDPWIAYGDAADHHHAWARHIFQATTPPLLTCEPVITEMCFLVQRGGGEAAAILRMVDKGIFRIALHLDEEIASVHDLMYRYRNVPMSLADACLVRLSELFPDSAILTLDSDFTIYRRYGRQAISLLTP
jgi:predicted nucleic acid-binding protein